jgi:glycosyltransferase involved in cell wall biosynthesis
MRVTDPPSVVVAAETWFGSTTFGIAQGFRRLGWDVHDINTAEWFPHYRGLGLRLAKRVLNRFAVQEYNRLVRSRLELLRPDLFLTVKGLYLEPETLSVAAECGIRAANYYPDFHFDYAGLDRETFARYDHFFTTKPFQIDYLASLIGRQRVTYLPHGYVADVHQPPQGPRPEYVCDVVYVGRHSAAKERALSELRTRMPQLKLHIYGYGWDAAAQRSVLSACIVGQEVLGVAYCRALSSARIALAIHSGPRKVGGWEDQVSTRTFEIPACRAFMLHIDTPEVRTLFEPHHEIGVFSDTHSLCDAVTRYLADDELREQMIERAWRRCVPHYSYEARARRIAEWAVRAA